MTTNDNDIYVDHTYIMYILCDKTASFYYKIKNIINIPVIICSAVLSIFGSMNYNTNLENTVAINMTLFLNIFVTVAIALLNFFKITEKEFFFKSYAMNFFKLHNKINGEITKSKTIMINLEISQIINEYNVLCENITFNIPSRIKDNVAKRYADYKLPTILINNKPMKKKIHIWNFLKNKEDKTPSVTDTLNSNETTIVIPIQKSFADFAKNDSISIFSNDAIDDMLKLSYKISYSPLRAVNKKPIKFITKARYKE
jgi:hypothetical protein